MAQDPLEADVMTQRRQAAWQAADRGARLLDAQLPGWHATLDLPHFNIGSGLNCVVGQLAHADMEDFYAQVGKRLGTGDYSWGIAMLMGQPELAPGPDESWPESGVRSETRRRWAGEYGFDLPSRVTYTWSDLQEAWTWQIARRQGTDPDGAVQANWHSRTRYHIRRVTVPWPDGQVPS